MSLDKVVLYYSLLYLIKCKMCQKIYLINSKNKTNAEEKIILKHYNDTQSTRKA